MEEKLRQALVISRGSFMTFVRAPPQRRALLLVALVLMVIAILPSIRQSREEVFKRLTNPTDGRKRGAAPALPGMRAARGVARNWNSASHQRRRLPNCGAARIACRCAGH